MVEAGEGGELVSRSPSAMPGRLRVVWTCGVVTGFNFKLSSVLGLTVNEHMATNRNVWTRCWMRCVLAGEKDGQPNAKGRY
jgi:hypothetical protein